MRRIAGLLVIGLVAGCDTTEAPAPPASTALPVPVAVPLDSDGMPQPEVLAESQVLHRGNSEEPATLDPHRAEGVPAANILRDLFEGLVTTDPEGRLVPGAAGRWDISRDGLTYTFYLRDEGAWSNGDPLTADDFVYSMRRSVNPDTATLYGRMLAPVANAPDILAGRAEVDQLGVEALNELTVQIRLTSPTPYFLGLLTHAATYPVHRESLERHGSDWVQPGNLVSNGAYQLSEWNPRASMTLKRNPFYHDAERVLIDEVVYYPIEDQNTEFQRFRAGDLAWTDEVPHNQFRWIRQNLPNALNVSPWFGSYFFGFNLTRPPFEDNLELRQALTLAIDRDILTGKVTQFGELPSFRLVPEGLPDYQGPEIEAAGWSQSRREERARELYREAGYSAENPLEVELRYNTSENHRKLAVAISAMWKQVLGVRTRLVNEEFRVFLQNRELKRVTEVFRMGWIGDYQDPFTFLELFRAGHRRNDSGYANSSYDQLLEQIASERIPARRRNLMREAERMLLADQVVLPVYTYVTKRLVHPLLRGWAPNVMDFHLSRQMYFVRARGDENATASEPEAEAENSAAAMDEGSNDDHEPPIQATDDEPRTDD